MFSIMIVPFCSASNSAEGFQLLHVSTNTWYSVFFFFNYSFPNRCEVVSCGFDLRFLDGQ